MTPINSSKSSFEEKMITLKMSFISWINKFFVALKNCPIASIYYFFLLHFIYLTTSQAVKNVKRYSNLRFWFSTIKRKFKNTPFGLNAAALTYTILLLDSTYLFFRLIDRPNS